jgi:hypothetical protein
LSQDPQHVEPRLAATTHLAPLLRTRVGWLELSLAAVQLLLITTAVTKSSGLRQDASATKTAVAGYEALTHDTVIRVFRVARFGSCAVVEIEGAALGYDLLAVARERETWVLKGEVSELADVDDVSDAALCREAVDSAHAIIGQ